MVLDLEMGKELKIPFELSQDWLPKTEDTVLISGGTRGIGLSLAKRIADSGATLLLLGRSALSEDAKAFVAERSETVFFVQADVCDKKGLPDMKHIIWITVYSVVYLPLTVFQFDFPYCQSLNQR